VHRKDGVCAAARPATNERQNVILTRVHLIKVRSFDGSNSRWVSSISSSQIDGKYPPYVSMSLSDIFALPNATSMARNERDVVTVEAPNQITHHRSLRFLRNEGDPIGRRIFA